jgi:hypothetical protein
MLLGTWTRHPCDHITPYHTLLLFVQDPVPSDDEIQALDEEEYREIFDATNQVPGNYRDAMNSKTELGAAVRDACNELDALRGLETDVIKQAEDLLKGIGYKGSLFDESQKTE